MLAASMLPILRTPAVSSSAPHVVRERVDPPEDLLGAGKHGAPRLRRLDPSSPPDVELLPEFVLELFQLDAHRGLRHEMLARGRAEAPVLDGG